VNEENEEGNIILTAASNKRCRGGDEVGKKSWKKVWVIDLMGCDPRGQNQG